MLASYCNCLINKRTIYPQRAVISGLGGLLPEAFATFIDLALIGVAEIPGLKPGALR
jgi:hypothetical protein